MNYEMAVKKGKSSRSSADLREVETLFKKLGTYKDSKTKAHKYHNQVESALGREHRTSDIKEIIVWVIAIAIGMTVGITIGGFFLYNYDFQQIIKIWNEQLFWHTKFSDMCFYMLFIFPCILFSRILVECAKTKGEKAANIFSCLFIVAVSIGVSIILPLLLRGESFVWSLHYNWYFGVSVASALLTGLGVCISEPGESGFGIYFGYPVLFSVLAQGGLWAVIGILSTFMPPGYILIFPELIISIISIIMICLLIKSITDIYSKKLKKSLAVFVSVFVIAIFLVSSYKIVNEAIIIPSKEINELKKLGLTGRIDEMYRGLFTLEQEYGNILPQIDTPQMQYNVAVSLENKGDYGKASEAYCDVGKYSINSPENIGLYITSYKRALSIVMHHWDDIITKKQRAFIHLGEYKWRVLDYVDGKALLITAERIEAVNFKEGNLPLTYQDSLVREYLNEEFYYSIGDYGNATILDTTIYDEFQSEDDVHFDDKVFILSKKEVEKYFYNSGDIETDPPGGWWLRTPGSDERRWVQTENQHLTGVFNGTAYYEALTVSPNGYSAEMGTYGTGVRPAIWVELE